MRRVLQCGPCTPCPASHPSPNLPTALPRGRDFFLNWLHYTKAAGIANFIVGALDEGASRAMTELGVPCFGWVDGEAEKLGERARRLASRAALWRLRGCRARRRLDGSRGCAFRAVCTRPSCRRAPQAWSGASRAGCASSGLECLFWTRRGIAELGLPGAGALQSGSCSAAAGCTPEQRQPAAVPACLPACLRRRAHVPVWLPGLAALGLQAIGWGIDVVVSDLDLVWLRDPGYLLRDNPGAGESPHADDAGALACFQRRRSLPPTAAAPSSFLMRS